MVVENAGPQPEVFEVDYKCDSSTMSERYADAYVASWANVVQR